MVKDTEIKLNTINDITEFCDLASKNQGEVLLISDRYRINGKSFQGIISLDLSKPIKIEVDEPIDAEFAEGIKKFVV